MADSAKITLKKMQIKYDTIIRDMQNEKNKMQDLIDELQSKIIKYREELDFFKNAGTIVVEDKEIHKKILTFRARQFNIVEIKNKLTQLGIEYDIDKIDTIVSSIDLLDNELILFYEKEREAYEEQIKIDKNIQKEALLRDNQFLIDKARIMIDRAEKSDDGETLGKYMDKYDKYINTRTKLLGDVVLEKEEEENTLSREVQDMKNEIKNNAKILTLNLDNVKTI